MASETIMVNGEAAVSIQATGGSLLSLGVSMDGVELEITDLVRRVDTDTWGGGEGPPADEQQMGQVARISILLMSFVESTLTQIRGPWIGATDGQMIQVGSLFGANNKYFRLLINSPDYGLPYNFLNARCDGGKKIKLGTVASGWQLSFFAKPHMSGAGSTAGKVLYNRSSA